MSIPTDTPTGTEVEYMDDTGGPHETVTRSMPFQITPGCWFVEIEGKPYPVALGSVTLRTTNQGEPTP